MSVTSGDRLRITAVMSLGTGITIENVYDVRCVTIASATDIEVMQDMAQWLDDCYAKISANMSSSCSFLEVRGFNEGSNAPMPTVAWPTQTVGSSAAQLYVSGVAALVLFRTGAARVLGRKFLGGWTENDFASGVVESGVAAFIADYALAVMAGPAGTESGGTFEYNIYDKLGSPHTVIDAVVSLIPAYQRRRRAGRGI